MRSKAKDQELRDPTSCERIRPRVFGRAVGTDPGDVPLSTAEDPGDVPLSTAEDPGDVPLSTAEDPGDVPLSTAEDPAFQTVGRSRTETFFERVEGSRCRFSDAALSGFIIVRLSDRLDLTDDDALRALLAGKGKKKARLEAKLGPPRRLIQCIDVAEILALEGTAATTAFPPRHSLAAYWRIDARCLPGEKADELVALLASLPGVDLAYRELAATDPQRDPFVGLQAYLDAAPVGIDARSGWRKGARGDGVRLVDLEQGWLAGTGQRRGHEDVLGRFADRDVIYGHNRHGQGAYRGDHGTAVLGVAVAKHDRVGVAGIAPGAAPRAAAPALVVSHYHGTGSIPGRAASGQFRDSNGHVADGIVAVLSRLTAQQSTAASRIRRVTVDRGDVLLLEVQRGFLPAEVDHADFDAIRLATALGLVVIEAAGNGGFDLDAYRDETGARILARGHADHRESGAVLVGASRSTVPHRRARFSCFGSRLDCFAWGRGVVTAGYGDLARAADEAPAATYTRRFGGTSAAAPIVAGAALLIQSLAKQAGAPLTPAAMRRILTDPTTGTVPGAAVPGRIGVMPDLERILARQRLGADVYLRSDEGDDGLRPAGSRAMVTGSTPDIAVKPAGLTLVLRNRGTAGTTARATVYRSPLATVALPTMWRSIGRTRAIDVPRGNAPRTTPAIPLRAAQRAPACYLAVVEPAGTRPIPLPPDPPYFDWAAFLAFNRRNPRRNVVDPAELGQGGALPTFLIVGAPDRLRTFDFEILQQLAASATVSLTVPAALAGVLEAVTGWPARPAADGERAILDLPPVASVSIPGVQLGAEASHACILTVTTNAPPLEGNAIAVRQVYRGEEIGRVTFRL